MRFSQLVVRNFRRSPLRAGMTVMTVAIMLAAFIFPRALVDAQEEHVRQAPNNRVVARPKQGWGATLPLGYADQIRELPGVRRACATRLPGLRLPGKEKTFFQSRASEMEPFLEMVDEIEASPEQKQAFLADERGAFVSETLAAELGWKLGDRVVFDSRQQPGQWELTIAGMFRSLREGYGERTVWMHYRYFNRTLPKEQQDRVNWIAVQIFEPNQGGQIAVAIDSHFDAAPNPTMSLEDRVSAQANLGNFSAILTALDVVSYLILAVVMSIMIHRRVAWLALTLGMGLSLLAAAVPVYRVAQLRVTDALRRLG